MDVDTSGVSFYNEPTEIEGEGYQPFVYLTHYSTQWRAIHASSPDTEEIEIIASSISDALHWAVELARECSDPIVTGGFGSAFGVNTSSS